MFWLLSAMLVLIALAFVLPTLWRSSGGDPLRERRDAIRHALRAGVIDAAEAEAKLAALTAQASSPTAQPSRILPIALLVLLPAAAFALYRHVGEPRAMDAAWQGAAAVANGSVAPAAADPNGSAAPDMEQAVSGLAERLKNEPDDLEGWMLLGRAYKSMERFAPAREALANAIRLAPENPDVMVEYAEAMVLASDSRRFEGEARELLDRAIALQPGSQRGLWLLGVANYQQSKFADAATVWERLLALIPPDAEPLDALRERIADARAKAGLQPLPQPDPEPAASSVVSATAAQTASGPSAATSSGPRLTVAVDIAPELKSQIGASDVLFVFARAAQGPRMPLAIQRLPAASLPITVTLDDSTSMMPELKLSTMPQVVVGARISKSGQATPQPGDFEALSDPIANTHKDMVRLTISKVLP